MHLQRAEIRLRSGSRLGFPPTGHAQADRQPLGRAARTAGGLEDATVTVRPALDAESNKCVQSSPPDVVDIAVPYALILLVLLGLGCSKKKDEAPLAEPAKTDTRGEASRPEREPGAAETASDSNAFPEAGAPPRLELSRAGREPRRVLRRNFVGGSKYSLQMRAYETMRLEMDLGDEDLSPIANPPVVYELSLQIREVTEEGTARVHFRVVDARAEKSGAVSGEELELLSTELRALRGLQGTYSVDAQGLLSDVEFDRRSATANPATLERLSQMLHWTTVPLPREQVGEGAAWTVKQVVVQDGVKVRQLSKVELLELDGSLIEVAVNIDKSAAPQKLYDAEAYELLQLKSMESLQTKADLNQLVPLTSKATGKLEMATRVPVPDGHAQDVQANMDLQGSLRGRRVTD
jgi:hypothetical protein